MNPERLLVAACGLILTAPNPPPRRTHATPRRILIAAAAGVASLAAPAAAQATFTGPHASQTREGFYTVGDHRYEQSKIWEARWFGQHEDGSNMWHVFDSMGAEYTASCQIMPGVDFDNHADGGPATVECGVTPVQYHAVHPAEWPEAVRVKVAQLDDALTSGMTEHMPYAEAVMPKPAPVDNGGSGGGDTYC